MSLFVYPDHVNSTCTDMTPLMSKAYGMVPPSLSLPTPVQSTNLILTSLTHGTLPSRSPVMGGEQGLPSISARIPLIPIRPSFRHRQAQPLVTTRRVTAERCQASASRYQDRRYGCTEDKEGMRSYIPFASGLLSDLSRAGHSPSGGS